MNSLKNELNFMSIFHVKNISEKPPSYTHDPNVKDIDYQTIKN